MALNAFLKFEGEDIEGGSVVEGHTKELQLLGFGITVHNSGSRHSSTGGGQGKGEHGDLSFQMELDRAGPLLHTGSMAGDHFTKATLFVLKAGGDEPVKYIEFKMEDVLISSFSWSGGGGDTVMASGSVNFARYEFTYTPQEAAGEAGGDVVQSFDIAVGKKT